jgi:predicted ATP-dependent endonuclease of OLD family
MRIKSITLQNYKRFVNPIVIDFTNPWGEINDNILFLGDNGSGKSSILQAIVAVLGSVCRENFNLQQVDWPGYEFRHWQNGPIPLRIEIEVVFREEEIAKTVDYARNLIALGRGLALPTTHPSIILELDFARQQVKAKNHRTVRPLYQFSGHQYAKQLASQTPNKNGLFDQVGNVFWYTEQRNAYSISNLTEATVPQLDTVRAFLASAYNYHLAIDRGVRAMQPGEFDFYAKLNELFGRVFPGRSLVGATPRFDIYEQAKAPDFFLTDGQNQYELSGMSAGERAIFPILMDFTRFNINYSIIIIDEVELHLHPPLQQAFVRALPRLGQGNQFILTSHSDSVAAMFDESQRQIIRLANA